jgi:hypothetical protein
MARPPTPLLQAVINEYGQVCDATLCAPGRWARDVGILLGISE